MLRLLLEAEIYLVVLFHTGRGVGGYRIDPWRRRNTKREEAEEKINEENIELLRGEDWDTEDKVKDGWEKRENKQIGTTMTMETLYENKMC